jgi:acetyl-CoA acetyltransferase
MMFSTAYIPYRAYYSSPYSRYGKTFKNENAIELSSATTKKWMESKSFDPSIVDFVIYGNSVHQHHGFWAGPWSAALIGAVHTTGTMISQACTTGATAIYQAASNVELGLCNTTYTLVADRTSNGPIVQWAEYDKTENWIEDNFLLDPWGKTSMLETADRVANSKGISKSQVDDITVRRYEQYYSLSERPYIFETLGLKADEGVKKIDHARLARLSPVQSHGVHSIGNLTYPADGHCGIFVTDPYTAKEMSSELIPIQLLSYGYSRCEKSMMPIASVDAAKMALKNADASITDMKVVNQHNAFAVNDIAFANEFGIDPYVMNNYGSPLVYGHPQSPVLSRLIIEGIEEAVSVGGGYVLVAGAAGGDTGAAVVLKVG